VTDVTGRDFEALRPRLTAIAPRILESNAEADDVVQEAWLRASGATDIDDPPAWSTTVATRLCLDRLRRQRTRTVAEAGAAREPEPPEPESDALVAERVGGALQVMLDALGPAERAALVLHGCAAAALSTLAPARTAAETCVSTLEGPATPRLSVKPWNPAVGASDCRTAAGAPTPSTSE
jgi:RNA polymerase sigma-70 factor (ECF subfamily)